MDLLRWNLVQGVMERLAERMRQLAQDEEAYLPLLQAYVAEGAEAIERDQLVAELNGTDLKRLQPGWEAFLQAAGVTKAVQLGPDPIETLGGVLIRSTDNRIRLNNTFEGRLQRLHERLHQQIVERLLPSGSKAGLGPAE
jgi:V/A-type H+-transporting ATPase subunit E